MCVRVGWITITLPETAPSLLEFGLLHPCDVVLFCFLFTSFKMSEGAAAVVARVASVSSHLHGSF